MEALPHDLLKAIFSKLDAPSLYRAGHVCRGWRAAACDEELWTELCRQYHWHPPAPNTSREVGIMCGVRWCMGRVSVVVFGHPEEATPLHTAIGQLAALSGCTVPAHPVPAGDFDWAHAQVYGLLILLLLPSADDDTSTLPVPFQRLASGSGNHLQGLHVALYARCPPSTTLHQQLSGLANQLQARGMVPVATCIDPPTSSHPTEGFALWNRRVWRAVERSRGWAVQRRVYRSAKVLGPTELTYGIMNRHHLVSATSGPVAEGHPLGSGWALQPRYLLSALAVLVAFILRYFVK